MTSWVAEFVLLAAIWGSSFLFIRIGAVEFGTLPTAAMRVGVAAAFLFPILMMRRQVHVLRQHWKKIFAIGVINSGLPFALYAFALQLISTGLSALLNATVPLFAALIAWAWLKDRPTGSRIAGLLVGFIGVAMLAWDEASFKPGAGGIAPAWGVIACLLATMSYGLAANAAKKHLGGLPALVTATGSQVGSLAFLAIPAALTWPHATPSAKAWGALVALGVLCTGIAYILYFRLIEHSGPAKALAVTFLVPVFAVIYGVLLLGEHVTAWMLVCGAVIVCGTALSTGLVKFGKDKA